MIQVGPSPFRGRLISPGKATSQKPERERKYGCAMLLMPPETAREILAWVARAVPSSLRMPDGGEGEPHVTLKYGFHDLPGERQKVVALVRGHGPVHVTLGPITLFPDSGDGEVLKIEVQSSELHSLYQQLSQSFNCEDRFFPHYRPHVTLAYLKPGYGKRYVGLGHPFAGRQLVLDTLKYSSAKKEVTLTDLARAKVMSAYSAGAGGDLIAPPAWMGPKPREKEKEFPTLRKAMEQRRNKRGHPYCIETTTGRRVPCPPKVGASPLKRADTPERIVSGDTPTSGKVRKQGEGAVSDNHPFADKSPQEMRQELHKNTGTGSDINPWNLKPEADPVVLDSITKYVSERMQKNPFHKPTMAEAFAAARVDRPDLTLREFQNAVFAGMKAGKLRADPYTLAVNTMPEDGMAAAFPLDKEIKFYLDVGSHGGVRAPIDFATASPEAIDAHMATLTGPPYGEALDQMPRDVATAYLERKRKADRFKARSSAASRGQRTKERKASELGAMKATSTGGRLLAAREKMKWLDKRARININILDSDEWRKAETELRNASLAHSLEQELKNPHPQSVRRDQELPPLSVESGPEAMSAIREPGSIPWVVSWISGPPQIISGAALKDSATSGQRQLVLYGTSAGTMDGDAGGHHGVYNVTFDRGNAEESRRARRLVWQIANGKAQNVHLDDLQELIVSGAGGDFRLTDEGLFSGTDALGREWREGKLVGTPSPEQGSKRFEAFTHRKALEEKTDKRGQRYCIEKGRGRVPCPPKVGGSPVRRVGTKIPPEEFASLIKQASDEKRWLKADQIQILGEAIRKYTKADIQKIREGLGLGKDKGKKQEMAAALFEEVRQRLEEVDILPDDDGGDLIDLSKPSPTYLDDDGGDLIDLSKPSPTYLDDDGGDLIDLSPISFENEDLSPIPLEGGGKEKRPKITPPTLTGEEADDHIVSLMGKGFENSTLSPQQMKSYSGSIVTALKNMPPLARDLAASNLKEIRFAASLKEVTQIAIDSIPKDTETILKAKEPWEQEQIYEEVLAIVKASGPRGEALEKELRQIGANGASSRLHIAIQFAGTIQQEAAIKRAEESAKEGRYLAGGYKPEIQTLLIDGGDKPVPEGEFGETAENNQLNTYAHELAHAIDYKFQFSGSDAWVEAWRDEIEGGQLTKYATTQTYEGFAEFARLPYSGEYDLKRVEQVFPKATKFFKDNGLWP